MTEQCWGLVRHCSSDRATTPERAARKDLEPVFRSQREAGTRDKLLQWGEGTVVGYEGDDRDKLLVRCDAVGDKRLARGAIEDRAMLQHIPAGARKQ